LFIWKSGNDVVWFVALGNSRNAGFEGLFQNHLGE